MQVESPSSARTIITAGVKAPAVVPPSKRYGAPPPPPPGLYPTPSSTFYKTVLVTTPTTTPTATVQPTLVSLPNTAPIKPLIGTVSPQNFSSSTFQTYPNIRGPGAGPGYQPSQPSQVYPGYPYGQQFGQQFQQLQGKADQFGPGYFIAGGAVPPYHATSASSSPASSGFPSSSAANSASPGFIYGPYSYGPYGAGRVIGPIIALGRISSRSQENIKIQHS